MQEIYKNSLPLIFNWLKTWENNGGYNGYVVHRYNGRRLNLNNPTCWAQGPIICGLVNLAYKDNRFESDLQSALKYQISLLQDNGKYKYCGHEDDRFTSLIHCSLANEGLMEGYKYFIDKDSDFANRLLQTVEINIEKYLLTLWNKEYGAFKFNDIDFYSHDGDRFVANMNITFIYTLILFAQIKNTKKYDEYINKTLDWFFTQQINSENKYLDGGFTYQQKVGVEPKMQNPVVIYNGIYG